VQGKHSIYQIANKGNKPKTGNTKNQFCTQDVNLSPYELLCQPSTMMITSPYTSFIFISVHILQPVIAMKTDWILCAAEPFDTQFRTFNFNFSVHSINTWN